MRCGRGAPHVQGAQTCQTAERPASQPSKQHSAEAPRAEGTCASCSRYAALTSVYGTCTALYVAGAAAGEPSADHQASITHQMKVQTSGNMRRVCTGRRCRTYGPPYPPLSPVSPDQTSQKKSDRTLVSAFIVGWLHEYMVHECAKSSLTFRASRPWAWPPPAGAAAPPGQGSADGPKVGLDGLASLGAGRAPCTVARWAGSATSAPEAERQCLSRRLTIACCLSTECCHQQAAGLRRSGRYRQHARGQCRRQRWSSAVDSTIKLACTTGVAHKARAQPSLAPVGGGQHSRNEPLALRLAWRLTRPSMIRRKGILCKVKLHPGGS